MEFADKYPIIIRRKIPFLTKFLLGVFGTCCIVMALCFFLFMPSLSSSNEMKVVTTIRIIPDYVKWLILYSGIGFFLFWFLYKYLIITKAGIINFAPGVISINEKKAIYQIPISNISRIELIDPTGRNDLPKGEFFVIIEQRNMQTFQFKLKDYYDSDGLIDNLLKYDALKDRIINPETISAPDIDETLS